MLNQLLGKRKACAIGLDIGSHAVKGVQLSGTEQKLTLTGISYQPLASDCIKEREVQDIGSLAQALKKIRRQHQGNQVATAISGSTVFSKVIQMDKSLSDDELEQQIEIEADSLIPSPLAEVYVDFEVLEENPNNSSNNNVLLSAARRQSVNSRTEALKSASMNAALMDIESYALGRAANYLLQQEQQSDDYICCIDIGATQTLMAILHQGKVIFASDQLFGTAQLLQSAAMNYQLTPQQALDKYNNQDFADDYQHTVLEPFKLNLVQQIKRLMQMYMVSVTHQPIALLLLSGSAVQSEEFRSYLQESFIERVAFAEPFSKMDIGDQVDSSLLQKHQQQMMVALGLALRGLN